MRKPQTLHGITKQEKDEQTIAELRQWQADAVPFLKMYGTNPEALALLKAVVNA